MKDQDTTDENLKYQQKEGIFGEEECVMLRKIEPRNLKANSYLLLCLRGFILITSTLTKV